MFSEYASRFLAQSQSRLSTFAGQQQDSDNGAPSSSRLPQGDWFSSRPSRPPGRSFLARGPYGAPNLSNNSNSNNNNNNNNNNHQHHHQHHDAHAGNPYQPAGSRFGFASHISAAQDAPLFRSVNSDFRDDDHGDDDDHHDDYGYEDDREAKDFLALQRSRRVAAASKLAESTETENDASQASLDQTLDAAGTGAFRFRDSSARAGGLRSAWANRKPFAGRLPRPETQNPLLEESEGSTTLDRGGAGRAASKGKGKVELVDVGLESQMADDDDDDDDDVPESLLAESVGDDDTSPPAFQQFKSNRLPTRKQGQNQGTEPEEDLRDSFETDAAARGHPDAAAAATAAPATLPLFDGHPFKYDGFFACSYIILQFALFSTFILVWLQTTTPTGPIGDTIYTVLRSSFHMLAVDTLVSIVVALFWLAALRSFVRPIVWLVVLATPVVLVSFSLYPFISSFKGDTHGGSVQDRVMRWTAVIPAVLAVVWVYLVARSRRAIRQAIEILEFSSRILAANPALLILGLFCLGLIVVWTWTWLVMFNRIFLEGHFSRTLARWIMSVSSWWLGAWFIFMHMWTVSIIIAVQQAATAATVSQWYFHRNAGPAPASNQIVLAAVSHATSKIFGSICESTLLSLLVRVPLLIMPGRSGAVINNLVAFWMPTSVAALINPLTVTFSAIHSQSLGYSAKGIRQMDFLSPDVPTTTLVSADALSSGPWNSRPGSSSSLFPYRLAKTILVGTRWLMTAALGFGGWVWMAKSLSGSSPSGMGWRGSAYAYVVGIVASFIGYYIMGTMEGVLSGIIDAAVVCYGSERRMLRGAGGSAGAYCMEAAYLFGDRRRPDRNDDDERGGLI